jgi:hypothetical protein
MPGRMLSIQAIHCGFGCPGKQERMRTDAEVSKHWQVLWAARG